MREKPFARARLTTVVALALVAAHAGPHARAVEPGAGAAAAVEARVAVSPLVLRLELDTGAAAVGEPVKARARVLNAGAVTVRDVLLSIRVDTAALVVKGGRVTIAQLPSGRTGTVGWTLCGRAPGVYLVLAQATLDGLTIESPARILTIAAGPRAKCTGTAA